MQIWATSNLWWEPPSSAASAGLATGGGGAAEDKLGMKGDKVVPKAVAGAGGEGRWRGGKWGGRRWDWREVGMKCVLPAGILYFVMAWAELIRRELSIGMGGC